MPVPDAEAVVREFIRRVEDGNVVEAASLFADGALNHGMQVTREQMELVLTSLRQAMPDSRTTLLDIVSDGNVVACRTRVDGTHLGTPDLPFVEGGVFAAGPPTGLPVTTTHMHWFKIHEGMIAEHWANRDDLGVARQLGLLEGIGLPG